MFQNFVLRRNWKTLSRISKRLYIQNIDNVQEIKKSFHVKKLQKIVSYLNFISKRMNSVTQSSNLLQFDKALITSNLSSISVERKMLEKYLKDFELLRKSEKKLLNSYERWLEKISPHVTLRKIKLNHKEREILIFLMCFLFSLILFFLGGLLLKSRVVKMLQKKLEDETLDIIQNSLIPFNEKKKKNFSLKFMEELEQCREYIHKRISLGAIFQKALPFPAILLDSNLNLLWGNAEFYKVWNLQKLEKDKIFNWEYLQRFTNLGEDDPVISALRHNLSGIYQIQVRNKESSESCPFEMYVSPMVYEEQVRVMIFFYPLTALQDTIASQTKSLVGPVIRSLEVLGSEDFFDEEFQDKIKGDFDIAGIGCIFEKFCTFSKSFISQKTIYLKEIELKENENFELCKQLDTIKSLFFKLVEVKKSSNSDLLEVRDSIVVLVTKRSRIEKSILQIFKNFKESLDASDLILFQSKDFKDTIQASRAVLLKLAPIRLEIRDFKTKLPPNESYFSTLLTTLDVFLSKLELLFLESKKIKEDQVESSFKKRKLLVDDDISMIKDLFKKEKNADNQTVHALRSLFEISKKSQGIQNDLDRILDVSVHRQLGRVKESHENIQQ